MFHAKDNKQGYIFEQFEYLGPKRLSELKNSWAGIFRIEILPELPVESRFANSTTTSMAAQARKCMRCWA